MLYDIISVDDGSIVQSFGDPIEANTTAKAIREQTGEKLRIVRRVIVAEGSDLEDWRCRERARFLGGEYNPVVWENASWFKESIYAKDHFVHMSVNDPKFIAYTPDREKGKQDRQTRTTPARYLKKFFPELEQYVINGWVKQQRYASMKMLSMSFATTPDEIAKVYTHSQYVYHEESITPSCMRFSARHFGTEYHPTYVYGAGDLAVAYIGNAILDGDITARTLVYKDKMVYSKIYGIDEDTRSTLEHQLIKQKYKRGTLEGARLLKIACDDDTFLMPYLDNIQHIRDCGTFFKIDSNGDLCADGVDGIISIEKKDYCVGCGSEIDEEGCYFMNDEMYCECCVTQCDCCKEYHRTSSIKYIDGVDKYVCKDCLNVHFFRCEYCCKYHPIDDCHIDYDKDCICADCIKEHKYILDKETGTYGPKKADE